MEFRRFFSKPINAWGVAGTISGGAIGVAAGYFLGSGTLVYALLGAGVGAAAGVVTGCCKRIGLSVYDLLKLLK